jgi:hypothetical protein
MVRDGKRRKTWARISSSHLETVKLARKHIYEENWAVDSAPVKRLLDEHSLTPTGVCPHLPKVTYQLLTKADQNAFSTMLSNQEFSIHSALVIDLLHEIELGVWKDVFTHLLRILQATGNEKIHELDRR